jgi:hypothetical protein
MAIGLVLPTTNATSLVVVAVVTAATSARQEAIATKNRNWRGGSDSDTSADESRDRDQDRRGGGGDKNRGGGDRDRRDGGDRDVPVSTRVTADGKPVSPNYRAIWLITSRIFGRAGSIRRHRRGGKATSRAAERLPQAQGYSPGTRCKMVPEELLCV